MNKVSEILEQIKDIPHFSELLKYIKKLENKKKEPQILSWIKTMFKHAKNKQWFETYWAFDIHGTISIPDYRK